MKKLLVLFFLVLSNILFFSDRVAAQFQSVDYSGNNPESYQCFDASGKVIEDTDPNTPQGTPMIPTGPDAQGNFYCNVGGVRYNAYLRPPALQQLEVWFVRILYAIWALVATLSFLLIVKLGYEYMISRGAPEAMARVRDRIVKYAFGFALVFLAVPVLSTTFRFLGINDQVQCYNVNMPGFQFFYTNLCTDPKSVIATDPCTIISESIDPVTGTISPDVIAQRTAEIVGRVCQTPGEKKNCTILGITLPYCFRCQEAGTGNPSLDRTWQQGFGAVCF